MKFLCWNIRGMNSTHKHNILHDLIVFHKINIVAIQETKKQDFTKKMLGSIANRFDIWVTLPSVGMSGGILVGCDSSQFLLEQAMIGSFSVTLMLKNRVDNTQWTFTSVYGPVDSSLKVQFWEELRLVAMMLG
jgi:exonuclease III